jgi:propionyl-CoA carboxylase alpha chain
VNIRLDSGVEAGSFVSVYYDSMLFKVISWGETREEARHNLIHALNRFEVEGVMTNMNFANSILNHPKFIKGEMTTKFIDEHYEDGQTKVEPSKEQLEAMVIASAIVFHNRQKQVRESFKDVIAKVGTSHKPKNWQPYVVKGNEDIFEVELVGIPTESDWNIKVNGTDYSVITPQFEYYMRRIKLIINGEKQYFKQQYRGHFIWTAFCGYSRVFEIYTPREWKLSQYMPKEIASVHENVLLSPLPGMVVNILVNKGDRVYRGQDLVVIESMKMESGVSSPCDGVVEDVPVEIGNAVETDEVLITFKT